MKNFRNFKSILTIMLLLFAMIMMTSCATPGGNDNDATSSPQDEATPTTEGGGGTGGDGTTPEVTDNGSGNASDDENTAGEEDTSGLNSYHSLFKLTTDAGTDTDNKMTRLEHFVIKDPSAKHMIYYYGEEDLTTPLMEVITIEDDFWVSMSGSGWMKQKSDSIDTDVFSQEIIQFSSISEYDDTFVGNENINGVNCKHFKFNKEALGTTVEGDMWVADQSGISNIVIKENVKSKSTVTNEEVTIQYEYEMDQINGDMSIEEPPNATDMTNLGN